MESLRQILSELWQPGPAAFWVAIGAILKHLWSKFRGRMSVVTWSAQYQHLAMSAQDARYGTLEVRFNGTPVRNLKMCYLQLENESATDLENLEVSLSFQGGSHFLTGTASVEGSDQQFPFTDRFATAMARIMALSPDQRAAAPEFAILFTRREYRIPVLNRYTKANFALLVETTTTADPPILVSCVHRGVRLRQRPAPRWIYGVFFGVPLPRAAAVGIIAAIIGTVFVAAATKSVWWAGTTGLLLGAAGTVLGAALIRLGRYALRVFG